MKVAEKATRKLIGPPHEEDEPVSNQEQLFEVLLLASAGVCFWTIPASAVWFALRLFWLVVFGSNADLNWLWTYFISALVTLIWACCQGMPKYSQ